MLKCGRHWVGLDSFDGSRNLQSIQEVEGLALYVMSALGDHGLGTEKDRNLPPAQILDLFNIFSLTRFSVFALKSLKVNAMLRYSNDMGGKGL